jgi:hypothetical protein
MPTISPTMAAVNLELGHDWYTRMAISQQIYRAGKRRWYTLFWVSVMIYTIEIAARERYTYVK